MRNPSQLATKWSALTSDSLVKGHCSFLIISGALLGFSYNLFSWTLIRTLQLTWFLSFTDLIYFWCVSHDLQMTFDFEWCSVVLKSKVPINSHVQGDIYDFNQTGWYTNPKLIFGIQQTEVYPSRELHEGADPEKNDLLSCEQGAIIYLAIVGRCIRCDHSPLAHFGYCYYLKSGLCIYFWTIFNPHL